MHLFVIKLGIVMHHHEPEYHAKKNVMRKKWESIFQVKVTVWAYIIKI